MKVPTPDDVMRAAEQLRGRVRQTPVFESASIDALIGMQAHFKAESMQRAGAFKFRGATNALLNLDEDQRRVGVATHSSGNHGAALALAATRTGSSAIVVMPSNSSAFKRAAVIANGGEVVSCEPTHAARVAGLDAVVERTGRVPVHPFEHPDVIAGQGTAALELMAACPDLDALLVPVGGGGLLSGTILATLAQGADAGRPEVYACEPLGADDAMRSFRAREHLTDFTPDTIADGLRTPLGRPAFELMCAHAADVVGVSEEAILRAMRLVWERLKLVIEPSSAVPLAAVLPGGPLHDRLRGARVGIVLSGGNVDLDNLPTWAGREAAQS